MKHILTRVMLIFDLASINSQGRVIKFKRQKHYIIRTATNIESSGCRVFYMCLNAVSIFFFGSFFFVNFRDCNGLERAGQYWNLSFILELNRF